MLKIYELDLLQLPGMSINLVDTNNLFSMKKRKPSVP